MGRNTIVCVIWVKNDTWDFNWSWKAGLWGLREEDGGGLQERLPWAGIKRLYLFLSFAWGVGQTDDFLPWGLVMIKHHSSRTNLAHLCP